MPVQCSLKFLRIARTCNLYLSFFGLGMCVAVLGPTLLDLERAVQTDTEHITYIYTARSSGYLLGSVVGGFLFDHFNRQFLLACSTLIAGLGTVLVPWWGHLVALAICVFICGVVTGALDTGGNVWCLDLWGQKSGPFMQALHFMFGFGAFAAPLISEPFLSPMGRPYPEDDDNSNTTVSNNSSSLINNTLRAASSGFFYDPQNGYFIINAYAIIGGFMILVSLLFVLLFALHPLDVEVHSSEEQEATAQHGNIFLFFLIFLAFFLFLVYAGLEVAFGQLIAVFAVKSRLKLSKSTGSYMTSVFWGAFMITRGVSIFWATRFSPFCMILCDLVLILLASIALVFFAETSIELLWAGTALLGIGTASVFPSLFAWFEQFIRVSNRIASLFIIASAVGEMLLPMLVGHFVDRWPMILMYATLCCSACSIALFLTVWKLTSFNSRSTTSSVSQINNKGLMETQH